MIKPLPGFLLTVGLLCVPTLMPAQTNAPADLISLNESYQHRLTQSVATLNQERENIQSDRLPLVRSMREKEEQVAELRRDVARLQRDQADQALALDALRTRVDALREQNQAVTGALLPDTLQAWENRLPPSTWQVVRRDMEAYRASLSNPDRRSLEDGLDLLQRALDHLTAGVGGHSLPGDAVDAEGRVVTGRYLELGPLLYFDSETLAGPARMQPGSILPQVQPAPQQSAEKIRAVMESHQGILPVLALADDHPARNVARETLLDHLGKGGIWVFPILGFALVATAIALVKSWKIFRIRRPRAGLIQELIARLRDDDPEGARTLAAAQPAPIGPMLAEAARHAHEPPELVEEIMVEAMLDVQPQLESGLNVIAVTAAAAPLLGLLGTVTGIMKTFNLMALYGAGDPRPLISGISEALVTTELGLLLAIPALLIHALLQRRVSGILADMEKHAVTFLNGQARSES